MNEVIIMDIYNIIKEFKDSSYDFYVTKRFKHTRTDIYFYPEIQITKRMMRNLRCSVRAQKTSMQKMSNYKMCIQNIPNSYVYSMYQRKPKKDQSRQEIIKQGQRQHIYYGREGTKNNDRCRVLYGREQIKNIHEMDTSINTSKVKGTKYEPQVTDISLIKALGYF